MLKKTLLAVFCLGSVCFADNFMIGSSLSGAPKVEKNEPFGNHEKSDSLPQRAVIEDINPSSDLGQLVTVMLKNEQKKAVETTKKAAAKKVVKKKKVTKKKPSDQNLTAAKDPYMEIKAEDPSKVNEQDKKAAEHNENNSSLKKITTSKVTH